MAAAYAALLNLSQIIHQILHPPPTHHFIIPAQQIECLQEQVSSLIDFLENYSSHETEDLERRIVAAAHKAEDIIESYVVGRIQSKYDGSCVLHSIPKEIIRKLLPIQKELKKKDVVKVIRKFRYIREEADKIRIRKGVEKAGPKNPTSSRSVPSGNNLMIGFDEHLDGIRIALATDELDLQIIPVVGMGGIGKTTLATHVYKDAYIVERFDFRAWVSVSLEYNLREIMVDLLQRINNSIEAKGLGADQLGNLLHKELFGRRYFVVLDDMWDIQAWDMLKWFLPNNGNGSRILVTTRLLNLAQDIKSCVPYELGLLNDESSWTLILEVFGKEYFPNELEEIGKSIARKCRGLPLALVVIGRLLAKSEKTRAFWEYVEQNVTSTANDENDNQCMKILRLSYSQLPVYLKPCFLYLAVFPKNVEIHTSRLIRLWVAEGFIKAASDKTLEEVAEGYLDDLFDRNLVMVKKRGLIGKVKTCSIHDLIRDLCTREVASIKFLCIPKLDSPTNSSHMKSERRMSIHIGPANKKVHKVLRSATLNRSLLSYSRWDSRKCVAHRLKLLRILDVIDFYSIEEILQQFNSRYITCNIPWELHAVSPLISLLWNLQTLIVPGNVTLPPEIWQMPQLRHLKMPGITLPDPPEGQGESQSIIVLQNLQTLSTVKDFIFRERVLKRIPNIKKLGIDCKEIEKNESFCLRNLSSLEILESLVLAFRGTLENMAFPSSLKKLSLSYCQIPWEYMSVVGALPNLEVLKLLTRAAKGRRWNMNANEFCHLKYLLIDGCEMENWVADDGHFPCLEHLHLVNMKMEEIPMEFVEIPTLQTINLNYCNRSLFASAKRISREREFFGYEEVQVQSFPSEAPELKKENVVDLEDEAEILKGYLAEETMELEVCSIIGMPGIGKTTLAEKIFLDADIAYEFPTRIWVYVSQEFTIKSIFLSILKEFYQIKEDIENETDKYLGAMVHKYLSSGKFLLVMDDVWSCDDWDKLQFALPKNNWRSKVLITSRSEKVAKYVNRHGLPRRKPHSKHFMTRKESFLLLQLEVFGLPECPPELEAEGIRIAELCGGLPLTIVVMGGLLRSYLIASSEMSVKKKAWEEVLDIFNTYHNYDTSARMEHVISLSYKRLPYHLRKCFLYMGIFPGNHEIPVWRLIRMWIAEGFIQHNEETSLEETAENHLKDLIRRNLVRVGKLKASGSVKTCRIHDQLRDFCKTEAGYAQENLFQEIKMSTDGKNLEPLLSEETKYRRLCIHSNVLDFLSTKPHDPSVHTFICSSRDKTIMPVDNISAIPTGFNQLRVLDVKPIMFPGLHSDMYQLVHLKYLVLSINLKVLPPAFSRLLNIQTLIVETTSRFLEIKADILNMIQLRHLKTNSLASLPKTSKSSEGAGEKIQTLENISPESCTEGFFSRARNLKKLGVRGDLRMLIDEKSRSFDSLGNLSDLENLKLLNDVFPLAYSEGKLDRLPPAYRFPPKLKILTLSETYLDWHYMSIIGSLDKLEVLKLQHRAFTGSLWETIDGGFSHLEVLHIGMTDLMIWLASHHHFPRLKHLQLKNCEELREIPVVLADVPSFQKLDLFRCRRAAASAKKIEAKVKENNQQSGNVARRFQLSIFPPVE